MLALCKYSTLTHDPLLCILKTPKERHNYILIDVMQLRNSVHSSEIPCFLIQNDRLRLCVAKFSKPGPDLNEKDINASGKKTSVSGEALKFKATLIM